MEKEVGYVGGNVGTALAVREVDNQWCLFLVADSLKLWLFRGNDCGDVSYDIESHKRKDLCPSGEFSSL